MKQQCRRYPTASHGNHDGDRDADDADHGQRVECIIHVRVDGGCAHGSPLRACVRVATAVELIPRIASTFETGFSVEPADATASSADRWPGSKVGSRQIVGGLAAASV